MDPNTRQKILSSIRDVPLKETLIFLVKHILAVSNDESIHKVSKYELIAIWAETLNHHKITSSPEFFTFLRILLDVVNEKYIDPGIHFKGMTESLLKDLKNQQKDRRDAKKEHVSEENSVSNISEEQLSATELTRL